MSSIRNFILIAVLLWGAAPMRAQQGAAVPPLRLDHRFTSQDAAPRALAVLPDTVRVLALMVDFLEDDDARTSGNGKFGSIYSYDYGTEILDPMPHDRSYFQQHLLFLENYVRKASGWKTFLKADVLDGIVTMPKKLAEYSFRKGESEKPVAQFAVDAWTLAGQQFPSVSFDGYHMFVIFHAGRGRDIDLVGVLGYDPTPFDIPSLSFTPESFRRLLGAGFDGIAMPDGSRITNCAVLPTTNIREIPQIDGTTGLLEITINGLLAASFGTYAGLPDLFDTVTGKTGIGRFGLMDGEGIFAFGGICPPEPSAWEKQQLGWTVAREVMPGKQNYMLAASDTLSTRDVLRVPITQREYWLLENRQRDLGGNGQLVTFVSGGQVQQVRFPKDTIGFENSNVQQLKGVVIDVEDFDWALPGGRVVVDDKEARVNGGILVWHVDENVIEENLAGNTVNTGRKIKGIDLEQAGGPQDIGVDITTVFGTETGTGSALDYWTRDNLSPVYKNRFDAFTTPNSRANSGAFTHVTMDNFSAGGPIMTVDIALGDNTVAPVAGWPVDVSSSLSPGEKVAFVQTADLDGDKADELLFVSFGGSSDTARLFIFHQTGRPFLAGSQAFVIAGASAMESGPAVADIDGDGENEIAVIGLGEEMHAYVLSISDRDRDGLLDIEREFHNPRIAGGRRSSTMAQIIHGAFVFTVPTDGATDSLHFIRAEVKTFDIPTSPPVDVDAGGSFAELGGDLYYNEPYGFYGNVLTGEWGEAGEVDLRISWTRNTHYFPAVGADIDGDGEREVIRTDPSRDGEYGRLTIFNPFGETVSNRYREDTSLRKLPIDRFETVSIGDLDGDGRRDVILSGSEGVAAINYAAASADYYPVATAARMTLVAKGESAQADRAFVVGVNTVSQLHTRARMADGFPLAIPDSAEVALFRTAAGRLGILAATSTGQAYLYETGNAIEASDLLWKSRFGNAGNNNSLAIDSPIGLPTEEFFPLVRCYNWPNPVHDNITRIRYYVAEDAQVTVKIYDLAGDKVDELQDTAIGGTDNEILWNVTDIQSDTYLAHVAVTAGGKKAEKIIKIAVVK
jgi:hypothetical protein